MTVVGTVITAVAGFFELMFACIFAVHKCKKEKICCFAPEDSEDGGSRRNSISSEDIELSVVRHESGEYYRLEDRESGGTKSSKKSGKYEKSQKANGNRDRNGNKVKVELGVPLLSQNTVESESDYVYQTCFENPS